MLTDTYIRGLKPGYNPAVDPDTHKARGETNKPYKSRKEQGLHVLVYPKSKKFPKGRKGWLHQIIVNGRETTFSYRTYPDVSLKLARERRDETRKLVVRGINPVAVKRVEKAARADTFEAIAQRGDSVVVEQERHQEKCRVGHS